MTNPKNAPAAPKRTEGRVTSDRRHITPTIHDATPTARGRGARLADCLRMLTEAGVVETLVVDPWRLLEIERSDPELALALMSWTQGLIDGHTSRCLCCDCTWDAVAFSKAPPVAFAVMRAAKAFRCEGAEPVLVSPMCGECAGDATWSALKLMALQAYRAIWPEMRTFDTPLSDTPATLQ